MDHNEINRRAYRLFRLQCIGMRISSVLVTLIGLAAVAYVIAEWTRLETPLSILGCASGAFLTAVGGLNAWLLFRFPLEGPPDDETTSTPSAPTSAEQTDEPVPETAGTDVDPHAGMRRAIMAARRHLGNPLKPIVIRGNGWGMGSGSK